MVLNKPEQKMHNECWKLFIKRKDYNEYKRAPNGRTIGRCVFEEHCSIPDDWVVHHIDENKLNNSLDNLLVFQDKSNHTRFHQLSAENRELIEVEPNFFICIKKRKEKISKKCSCEELKNLIRHNSFVQIGKTFGVSDNAIRKWCKSYNLPFLSRQIPLYTDKEWEKI